MPLLQELLMGAVCYKGSPNDDYVIKKRAKDIPNGLFKAGKKETFLSKIIKIFLKGLGTRRVSSGWRCL